MTNGRLRYRELAEDNERLRRLAVTELESTRNELNAVIRELSVAQADAQELARMLAARDEKLATLLDELAAAKAGRAAPVQSNVSTMTRVKRRVRRLAKKFLGNGNA